MSILDGEACRLVKHLYKAASNNVHWVLDDDEKRRGMFVFVYYLESYSDQMSQIGHSTSRRHNMVIDGEAYLEPSEVVMGMRREIMNLARLQRIS